MNRTSTTAGLAALICAATVAAGAPAQAALAYETVACDADGTTSADSAAAGRLNNVLQGDLANVMTAYRVSCARMIVDTIRQRGLIERAAVIAITTAVVESDLMNISQEYDHTSLGLFQQQTWWGTRDQRLDPVYATNAFIDSMLDKYPDGSWKTTAIGTVCQEVQQSALPGAYQPQAADAQKIVDELWTADETPPAPHGPLYDRARTSAGTWAANSSLIDANAAVTATAATGTTDGSLHTFVVVPGNGTWARAQNASGAWAGNATRIDTNGAVTDVAAAALPDGTLHVFVLVPGSGVWHRSRTAAGVWASNSSRVDANGSVSDVAAVGLADGTLNLAVVVPGSGTWLRSRTAAGVWASNSTHIDTNGAVTDVAYAGLPDNSLHLALVVPNSGTWVRTRTNGVWAANSARVDSNGAVIDVSAAGLADGTLHLAVVVPKSGTWVRARTNGVWAANSSRIDTNGKVFKSYTAGTSDNTLHLGVLVNTA
ncbi:hypothetical protein [Actinoplanes sp. CA-252034]|uniref:hypothetical protein n=1 Tax=Actinoplanes sp. CA-252034 TaxID=3239906 RepID=UPI003D96AC84